MKIKRGSTSVRRLIFVADSSSTTGAGLANLVYNTASLVAYYFAGDLSNEVQITLATATLGTFASGGFVAVDNTNMPGWYEIGIPDAALDGGIEVAIQFRGAANMVPVNLHIELDTVDYQTDAMGALKPTTAGRTLDVSAGGEAGIDWANVGSPTTSLALTGTTIATTQKVDVETIKTQALTAAAGITFGVYVGGTAASAIASTALSTAQWTNTLATDLGTTNTTVATNLNATVSSRLASVSYTAPPSAATISTQVASDLATAHGAGSWATATGFSTHSAADVWAVGTRTITGGSLTTAPPTAAVIADAVWNESRSGHSTSGTFGEKVNAELDSSTQTQINNIENASGYLLAWAVGACADPQTASETYTITVFGSTFTVDMAGQTSTGIRTAPTLTKS